MNFFLEIGLWVVLLNSGMLLWAYWRHGDPAERPFLLFLGANTALSAFLLFSEQTDSVLSFISIGVFVFTVLVPSFVGRMVDKALLDGRFELAYLLHTIREHLQPGRDWAATKQTLTRMVLVQKGRADEVIAELSKLRSDPEAKTAIDVEILNLLGLARRWDEVAAYFEEQIPDDLPAYHGMAALRLIRAYGELGRYQDMDRIMSLLEFGPVSQQPGAGPAMDIARLVYLAYMGQIDELDRLLSPRSGFAQNLPDDIRLLWLGIAAQHAGRFDEARRLFEKALRRIRSKATREEIEKTLESLEDVPLPPEDSPILQQELEQARAKAAMPRLRGGSFFRQAPISAMLVLANVVVYLAMVIAAGHGPTTADLIASGGNLKAAVQAGQYWRLMTAAFLHAHWAHIGLNMLVLMVLGRAGEAILGHGRYLAAYVISALVSGAATVWFGHSAPLSVGASGAIFGIMGALLSVLYLARDQWPATWRKSMLMLVAAMAALSMLPGLSMKIIDNWAHLGGLAGGVLAGALLWYLPSSRMMEKLLIAASTAAIIAGWAAYVTSSQLPHRVIQVEKVAISLPASWIHVETTDEFVSLGDLSTDARLFFSFKHFDEPIDPAQIRLLLEAEKTKLMEEAKASSIEMSSTNKDLFTSARKLGLTGITVRYQRQGRNVIHGLGLAPLGKTLIVVHMACPQQAVKSCQAALADVARSLKSYRKVQAPAT